MPEDGGIGLVVARSAAQADGIRDYTRMLSAGLRASAVDAEVIEWAGRDDRDHARERAAAAARLRTKDAVVVQYNPFSYGRWGFAPELPLFLARLRARRPRPRIAVMFHEVFVDMRDLRWALMGAWQRAQLLAVQATADVQLCSIQRWTERLARTALGRPVHHLPVASNLPDARDHRDVTRRALGAGDDTLVLACVGLRHPGRLQEHALAAARRAGAEAASVLLVDLGPGERSSAPLAPNVRLLSTGFLDVDALAGHVAASDVFLAPYMDGVSTRRSTVMGALAHGVAVAGTTGHLTDDVLRRSDGLVLVDRDGPERFAEAVAGLARDPARRAAVATRGRGLYERRFDWPVMVRRLRAHLDV
jgi:glycosyltransferase involved in cell wall biosynthesis